MDGPKVAKKYRIRLTKMAKYQQKLARKLEENRRNNQTVVKMVKKCEKRNSDNWF